VGGADAQDTQGHRRAAPRWSGGHRPHQLSLPSSCRDCDAVNLVFRRKSRFQAWITLMRKELQP
jgi:hypothetical protein